MAQRTGKAEPQLNPSDLLVMGYSGTLRPREDLPPAGLSPASAPLATDLPPFLDALLAQWLDRAAKQLVSRTPPALLLFRDQPIPLSGVLLILKDHLLGLFTQALPFVDFDAAESVRYNKVPLLLHLLRLAVADWTAATLVFLERFSRDHSLLASAHYLDKLPPVQAISGCGSDVHAGGHSVLRITFAGGATLYYKPRAVTGEWLWHQLLASIARQDPGLRLPTARVLTDPQHFPYGWVDSLVPSELSAWYRHPHSPDTAGQSATHYWHRAGAMLCLAQHLRLADLHLANILATPEGPAVVDAECLATPDASWPPSPVSHGIGDAFSKALLSLQATALLPTGYLPGRPDTSGFFGHAGPVEGITLPHWELSSDGSHHLQPRPAALVDHHNAPARTSPATVLPHLVDGYRRAAEALLTVRGPLLRADSGWRRVLEKSHAPRIVLRDTLTYAHWISRSLAPSYLRSHPKRQAAVAATLRAAANPPLPTLLRIETGAILQVHVPRLVLLPDSRTLANSSGRPVAHRFSTRTPAEAVTEQLERLSRSHLEDVLLPALLATCLGP